MERKKGTGCALLVFRKGMQMGDVVSDFNDAVAGGGPVRLYHSAGGGYEDVIPFVPQSAFGNIQGQYYAIATPLQPVALDPSRFLRLSVLPRVDEVRLVASNGSALRDAPHDLAGCFLEFNVRGIPRGDVYRVEVFPDPSAGPPKEIEQIQAGTHTFPVQHFKVPLRRGASAEVALAIYRVDAETAKRDRNADRPKEWEEYYRVR
jgi:hypothetical protein